MVVLLLCGQTPASVAKSRGEECYTQHEAQNYVLKRLRKKRLSGGNLEQQRGKQLLTDFYHFTFY